MLVLMVRTSYSFVGPADCADQGPCVASGSCFYAILFDDTVAHFPKQKMVHLSSKLLIIDDFTTNASGGTGILVCAGFVQARMPVPPMSMMRW